MLFAIVIFALVSLSDARPQLGPQNVVVVPPNCKEGQVWQNGQCRDVWRILKYFADISSDSDGVVAYTVAPELKDRNVITVPPNCPPGQEWSNGACRDVWRSLSKDAAPNNVVTVPNNCRPGQVLVNGSCRDIWYFYSELSKLLMNFKEQESFSDTAKMLNNQKNIITVPNTCPLGYKADANGICRRIFE